MHKLLLCTYAQTIIAHVCTNILFLIIYKCNMKNEKFS